MRLLIAEDDLRLLRSLAHIFETEGYLVDAVARGDDALAYAESGEYDGLVLDIMMPGRDGVSVLQPLRERGISTPALFLTAKDGVAERVQGLDAGADDYLAKPFSTSELLARVRAMLRRKDTYTPDLLEACGLVLDRSTFELSAGSERLSLSAKEYQIVEFFMNHAGMIISADKVLTHIWGWESDVSMSVLWVHISNIRKKLAALGSAGEHPICARRRLHPRSKQGCEHIMIYRLRKKFIRICMCSFLAVFVVLFGAIFTLTSLQTTHALDDLANIIAENDGRFPGYDSLAQGPAGPPVGITRESPFTTRFFTVRFDADGAVTTVDARAIASIESEDAATLAEAALADRDTRGLERRLSLSSDRIGRWRHTGDLRQRRRRAGGDESSALRRGSGVRRRQSDRSAVGDAALQTRRAPSRRKRRAAAAIHHRRQSRAQNATDPHPHQSRHHRG